MNCWDELHTHRELKQKINSLQQENYELSRKIRLLQQANGNANQALMEAQMRLKYLDMYCCRIANALAEQKESMVKLV